MKSKRIYTDYLHDIREACDKATQPPPSKSIQNRYPEVPWKVMAGMRDIVIHEYFRVDLKRVFETVRQDLPPLRTAIAHVLDDLEKN